MATKSKAPAEKPTRRTRTVGERIAEAEANLKALRERAEERANKGRNEAWAKREKLIAQIKERQAKVDAIDAEYPQPDDTTDE